MQTEFLSLVSLVISKSRKSFTTLMCHIIDFKTKLCKIPICNKIRIDLNTDPLFNDCRSVTFIDSESFVCIIVMICLLY